MNMLKTILVILLITLIYPSNSLPFPKKQQELKEDFPVYWYNQTLNHFDENDQRTFQQRYFFNDQYYNYNSGGPIVLYINGEGEISGPPYQESDGTVIYSGFLNAMIVTLEHRYYGESSPFDDLSTENLKFLTSQQALFDLANFVTDFSLNVTNFNGKIITIGGSYSGALSAWFRLKFPHITVGSVASSGVVNAILDFTAFDEWVAYSAGDDCADALRLVTKTAELYVFSGNGDKVKSIFNAENLVDDGDFFYWLADSMAEGIQYGFHDQLCTPLISAMNSNGDMLATYSNYTENVWGVYLGTPDEYATAYQQNTTHNPDTSSDRCWWYQTCSQLAYFQNAPEVGSIRSSWVNMTYHKNHCLQVFGELSDGSQLWPNTEAVNNYYGGNHTAGTNIIFTEGSQDPWSRASILSQEYPTEPLFVINCQNCGHCVDLRGCPGGCTQPNNLYQVRNETLSIIQSWLE